MTKKLQQFSYTYIKSLRYYWVNAVFYT